VLRHVRSVLVRAPHVRLLQLGRLDERIAAHLDGLAVSGRHGTALCLAALERPGAGEVFALAVRAIESRDSKLFKHALSLVGPVPEAARGVLSALGWVSASDLQGVVRGLLGSKDAGHRALGLGACRMHGVDPGPSLLKELRDEQPELRAAALRAAAELGRVDLLPQARESITADNADLVFWAAWAACVLGDRQVSLRVLSVAATSSDRSTRWAERAMALVMLSSPFEEASALARSLSQAAQASADLPGQRRLIRALGLLGDARFVPWLIDRMADPVLTRIAGESFSWITGVDLARADLETLQAPALPEHPFGRSGRRRRLAGRGRESPLARCRQGAGLVVPAIDAAGGRASRAAPVLRRRAGRTGGKPGAARRHPAAARSGGAVAVRPATRRQAVPDRCTSSATAPLARARRTRELIPLGLVPSA
jgi:uncharacterized protein (TIGR02270 family)